MDDAVELAELIGQLRHELSRAMWSSQASDLQFEAETVELELTVGVEKSRGPSVGVRFWVFDATATTQRSTMVTHRLTLTLHPRAATDPDKPARIAGTAFPNER